MGINASIFKSTFGSCSNGGLSERHDRVCVVNAEGPFEPCDDIVAVMIIKGAVPGALRCVPAKLSVTEWVADGDGTMFGGCFVYSSDSRFSECQRSVYAEAWGRLPLGHDYAVGGAVPLHDRREY